MLPGKKILLALLVPFLIVTISLNGQIQKNFKFKFNQTLSDSSFTFDNHSITFNYSVEELNIEGFANDYGDFYKIYLPGHISTPDAGRPELPVLSKLITIPVSSDWTIKITHIESEKIKPSDHGIKGGPVS